MRGGPRVRRGVGALLVLVGLGGIAFLLRDATDFPTEDPIAVVDAPLVARLRANPGLHLALAPDHRVAVELDLVDDPENRRVYGTDPDLRERRAERSIHIQAKDGRYAIHADGRNPRFGTRELVLHGVVDVPVLPLGVLAVIGLALLVWPPRRPRSEV